MGIFNPNIQFSSDTDKARFLLIWRLSLIASIALFALTIVFFFDQSSAKYAYLIGFSLTLFGVFFLKFTKKSQVLYIIYASGATLLMQIDTNLTLDTPHLANYFWVMLVIMLALFGTTLKIAFSFLIVNLIGIVYYAVFTMDRHYKIMHEVSDINAIAVGLELVCVLSIISYIVYLFIQTRQSAENKLILANSILEENNKEIVQRDEEKTILVKEIHHRVKNNLQIIISLLRLQMTDIKNAEAKHHFSEAINRVMVMSSIHKKLYQENNLSDFNLSEYINDLTAELKNFFCEEYPVDIEVNVDFEKVDLKTIVPIGLLLNELLSNSFKYAFENQNSGKISIEVKENGDYLTLEYSDNGIWKDADKNDSGFGLELIEILTEQLNGTKQLNVNKSGSHYTFNLQAVLDKV